MGRHVPRSAGAQGLPAVAPSRPLTTGPSGQQASGLPVVATNSSGITDVVAHGESGFLAPPGMSALG